jgi:hypothetical protein
VTVTAHLSRPFVRVQLAAVTVAVVAAALGAGAPVLAAPGVTFRVWIGDCTLRGTSSLPKFRLIWIGLDGHVKKDRVVVPDQFDSWEVPCADGDRVRIGDMLIARHDGARVRRWKVPRVTVLADRVTDVVRGEAPASRPLHLEVAACWPLGVDDGYCVFQQGWEKQVSAGGTWRHDTSADYDLRGGDSVYASYRTPSGDIVDRFQTVPYLEVQIGSAHVRGVGLPGGAEELALRRHGDAVARASAVAGRPFGTWGGRLRSDDGTLVRTRSGDVTVGDLASDARLTVPRMPVDLDVQADTLTGSCDPYGRGRVGVRQRSPNGRREAFATADIGPGGRVRFGPEHHLDLDRHDGWLLQLRCRSPRGDVAVRSIVVDVP